ncbi:MAG: hypothetical protein RR047_00585 [Bacilli bacterium]
MGLFTREDPKTILEGLNKAQKLLDDRYDKKLISPEVYRNQSLEFMKKREKYEKKLGYSKYDSYE